MNKVFLIGNLTRDPDRSETQHGVTQCRFTIAVNRQYAGSDSEVKTDFFNVIVWRNLAENVAQYCRKGSKVAVSGSIQLRTYQGNDAVNRLAVDIIGESVEFLTKASAQDESVASRAAGTPRKPPTQQSFDDDGDIPF